MKQIYLIHSARRNEAKKLFKKGVKFENLGFRMCTNSLWAVKELHEAINDCRRNNAKEKTKSVYWYEKIDLF